MRYVYYVTYNFNGGYGSCETTTFQPIEDPGMLELVRNYTQRTAPAGLVITNWKLLRTEAA